MPVLDRVARTVRARGISGTLLRAYDLSHNRIFDLTYGVDTGYRSQEQPQVMEGVPDERARHANVWQPTSQRILRRALKALDVPLSEYTFIDFGSGKGKALLIASEFPFRRIIGVEHAPELVRIAKSNIARFQNKRGPGTPIELVCCDVRQFDIPASPSIYFFFNPFDETVMRVVLQKISNASSGIVRSSFLVYDNPVLLPVITSMPDFQCCQAGDGVAILRTVPGTHPAESRLAQPNPACPDAVQYCRMRPEQLQEVVALHDVVFPGSTMSSLGISQAALRWHLAGPDQLFSATASAQGKVIGFGIVVSDYNRVKFASRNLPSLMLGMLRQKRFFFRRACKGIGAFLQATFKSRRSAGKVGKLLLLGVDPAYRGAGIGKALLRQIERDCAVIGLKRLELMVDPGNTPAVQLYQGDGWQKVLQHGGWRGVMSKTLVPNSR